jgi:hypothetical protein
MSNICRIVSVLECLLLDPCMLFIATTSLSCSCFSNSRDGWPDARTSLHASYLYNFKAVGRTGFSEIKKHPSLYEAELLDMSLVVHVTSLKHKCDHVYRLCAVLTVSTFCPYILYSQAPYEFQNKRLYYNC